MTTSLYNLTAFGRFQDAGGQGRAAKDRPAARVDACPACAHSWLAHGYRGGCQAEADDDPHWACGCEFTPERDL